MTVNKATLDLITAFEGFVDRWYPDPAHGWKVPTAMYGHTNATGNEPLYKSAADRKIKFTQSQGRALLAKDLAAVEVAVRAKVTVPLSANQFGALVSFTFNLGAGNLAKSTLLKKVNQGDWLGAAAEFAKWNKAGGKVMKGLVRRRAAEAALFSTLPEISDDMVIPKDKPVITHQPDDPSVDPDAQVVPPQAWWQRLIQALIDALLRSIRKD